MFGLLFGKKKMEKINLQSVVSQMSGNFWDVELHETKPDTIVVLGKYRNREKDFNSFLGGSKNRIQRRAWQCSNTYPCCSRTKRYVPSCERHHERTLIFWMELCLYPLHNK